MEALFLIVIVLGVLLLAAWMNIIALENKIIRQDKELDAQREEIEVLKYWATSMENRHQEWRARRWERLEGDEWKDGITTDDNEFDE